ncbi:MAG: hypothetical protein ACD_41C00248G0002 [uncultured bacterium]|nr:MAG: hypothetical protein ACD_41C00248G0002 [uncultured bacterium]
MAESVKAAKKVYLLEQAKGLEKQLRALISVFQRIKKGARALIVSASKKSDENQIAAVRKQLSL